MDALRLYSEGTNLARQGKNLEALKQFQGATQADLARASGVPLATISRLNPSPFEQSAGARSVDRDVAPAMADI